MAARVFKADFRAGLGCTLSHLYMVREAYLAGDQVGQVYRVQRRHRPKNRCRDTVGYLYAPCLSNCSTSSR
jgi:hypothetical protein